MAFEPITAEVSIFGPEDMRRETEGFIREADAKSLDATLFQAPDANYGSWFERTGRSLILNRGYISIDDPDYQKRQEKITRLKKIDDFAEYVRGQGVETQFYSTPDSLNRLHSKLYTADFNGRREAFISTSNLSAGAMGDEPHKAQVNFAFRTADKSIVAQVDAFMFQIRAGLQRPVSTRNFLTGGSVQNALEERISKLGKGDKLILTSPYMDSTRTIQTLIGAKKRGVDVITVVDKENRELLKRKDATSMQRSTMKATLQSHGIRVLEAQPDDPLLYHAKSIAAIDDDAVNSFLMHGSDNMTGATLRVSSLDVMLLLDNDRLAKDYYGKIQKSITDFNLTESRPSEKPLSAIEMSMQARGLGNLYRSNFRSISYSQKLDERRGGDRQVHFEGTLPFYPTTLPEEYYRALRHTKLPSLDVYSRLYRSRTGQERIPDALVEADRMLEAPGLGEQANRLLGFEIYAEGTGVVGSLFRGVGKVFDFAFGYGSYDTLARQRAGEFEGSLAKYQRNEMEAQSYTGPFERLFASAFNLMTGTAIAAGAYVGINLPFQHFMADVFQKSLDELIVSREVDTKTGMFSGFMKDVRKRFRNLFFGFGRGKILNEELEGTNPSQINSNIKRRLREYEDYFTQLEVKGNIAHLAKRGANNFGLRSGMAAFRRYDKAAFDILLRPIFEAISPYDLKKADLDEASPAKAYVKALDELSETIGHEPELVFKDTQSAQGQTVGLSLSNIGRDRVIAIAKAWDTLAASIPANIAYWHPAIRKALKLPEFDPQANLTIRDLVSFERATHWTGEYVNTLKDFAAHPLNSLKDTLHVWRNEAQLRLYERKIARDIRFMSRSAVDLDASMIDWVDDVGVDQTTRLQNLKETIRSKQESFIQTTYDYLVGGDQVKNYTKLIDEQDRLLRQRGHTVGVYQRNVDAQMSDTGGLGPQYKKSADNLRRLVRSRRTLALIGGALIANRILDDFFIKKQGISGITSQFKMWQSLNSEDGQVASFYFSDSVPKAVAALGAIGVGTVAGFMIPDEVDAFNDSRFRTRPGTVAGELRNIESTLGAGYQRHLQKAVAGMDETTGLLTDELSNSRKQGLLLAVEHSPGIKARRRLKFNSMAAVAGGLLAMVGIKTLYSAASYAGNFFAGNIDLFGNRRGSTPDMILGAISSVAESLIPGQQEIGRLSARDQSMVAIMSQIAAKNLKDSNRQRDRTYNIARQLTSPYLQVAIVSRTDSQKTTFGVGFQLMPVTGLGISPTLPFGLSKKDIRANTPPDSAAERMIDLFTLPWFSYMPDSNYEQMAMFLGASTAMAVVAGKLRQTLKGHKLLGPNAPLWMIKEAEGVKALIRPMAPFSKLLVETPYKIVRGVSALPFVAGEATIGGINAAFGGQQPTGRLPVHPSGSRMSAFMRRAAPYYLAIAGARMLADYYYGQDEQQALEENKFYNASAAEVSATITAGLFVGAILDYSGVFATADELALATYGDSLKDSPNPKVAERLNKVRRKSFLKVPGRNSLYRTIVGDAEDFKNAIITAPKGSGPKLATTKFKSVGARVALAFMILGGLRAASAAVVSGLSDLSSNATGETSKSSVTGLFQLPLLGPMLRILSRVSPEDQSELRPATGKHSTAKDTVMNMISAAASAVFAKDLVRMIGLYSDTPDPFFGIPFGGFSFKDSGVAFYLQFATSGSDFSMSAYDLVQRSASLTDVISWRSLLEDGPPQNFRQFYERARGGNLRTKAASYKSFTNYELNAISSSGGLARALQIKNSQVQNLGYQYPNEILMDFFLTGFMHGKYGTPVLPHGKFSQVYDPFAILDGGFIGVLKKDKDGLPTLDENQDIEQAVMAWMHSSTYGNNEVIRRFNPLIGFFSDTDELSRLGTPDPVGQIFTKLPWLVATGGVLGTMAFSIGMASLRANRSEYTRIYESSKIVRNVSIFNSTAYKMEAKLDPETGRFKLYQIFANKTFHNIPIDLTRVMETSGIRRVNYLNANKIASNIASKHKSLIKSVNSFFLSSTSGKNLNILLTQMIANNFSDESITEFRKSFKESLSKSIAFGYRANVQGKTSLFDVLFSVKGQEGTKPFLSDYMDNVISGQLDEMVDAVVEVSKTEAVLGAGEDALKMAYMKQALEESKATRTFVSMIELPNPAPLSPEDAMRVSRDVQAEARSQANREIQKVYSEGVARSSLKAGKSIGRVALWWGFVGQELYSITESIGLLADDKRDPFVRKAAAKQLVRSLLFTGQASLVGAGVAYGAAALGITLSPLALGALALGGLGALTFGKRMFGGGIQRAEDRLINTLSNFVYDPVETTARSVDNVGLGDPIRAVGRPAGAIGQQILKTITSPVRFFTDNIAGPFFVQRHLDNEKAGLGWQTVNAILLPETAYYGSLVFEPGRRSFQGTEPFIYGNPKRYWAYQQVSSVKRATAVSASPEDWFVHPEVLGRSTGFRQDQIYTRYFKGYASGRILANFNLDSSYLSARLRQELKIRQWLLDMMVTSAPLRQMREAQTYSGTYGFNSLIRSWLSWTLPEGQGTVYGSLKALTNSVLDNGITAGAKTLRVGKTIGRVMNLDVGKLMMRNTADIIAGRVKSSPWVTQTTAAAGKVAAQGNIMSVLTRRRWRHITRPPIRAVSKAISGKFGWMSNGLLDLVDRSLLWMRDEAVPYVYVKLYDATTKRSPVQSTVLNEAEEVKTSTEKAKLKTVQSRRVVKNLETNFLRERGLATEDVQTSRQPGMMLAIEEKRTSRLKSWLSNIGRENLPTKPVDVLDPSKPSLDAVAEPAEVKSAQEEAMEEVIRKKNVEIAQKGVSSESKTRAGIQWFNQKIAESGLKVPKFLRSPMTYIKGGFVGMDTLMSMQADARIDELKTGQHGGHYRVAYADQYASVFSSYAAMFTSNLRVNPIFGIGAVFGGIFAGSTYGSRVGAKAYYNRYDERKERNRMLQMAANVGLTVLGQVPIYLRALSHGNIKAIAARGLTTMLFGGLVGGLGFGAASQASFMMYGSQLMERTFNSQAVAKGAFAVDTTSKFGVMSKTRAAAAARLGKNSRLYQAVSRFSNSKLAKASKSTRAKMFGILRSNGVFAKFLKSSTRFLKNVGTGPVGKFIGAGLNYGLSALQVAVGAADIKSGYEETLQARTRTDLINAQKNYGRGVGTIAGFAAGAGVGMLLGLPGLLVGGLVGLAAGFATEKLGPGYAERAISRNVPLKKLAQAQTSGTALGGVAGALVGIGAGAGLAAAGVISAPVLLAGAALGLVGMGIGSLVGYITGSESVLRKKKVKPKQEKSSDTKAKQSTGLFSPKGAEQSKNMISKTRPKENPANKKQTTVFNNIVSFVRGKNGSHQTANWDSFANKQTARRAQNTVMVASAIGSDTAFLTDADFQKEMAMRKESYKYLNNTGYQSLDEKEMKAYDEDQEQQESFNQPWWLKVFSFMNNIWGTTKSNFGKLSDKIKSSFGTAYGHIQNFLAKTYDQASDYKKWFGSKAVAAGRGVLSKLGQVQKRFRDALRSVSNPGAAAGIAFNPVFHTEGASYLSEADFSNLVMMSIFESTGTKNQLDVAVSILNRQALNRPTEFMADGNSVTDIIFAPKQYEPTWKYGLSRAKNIQDAAQQIARVKGISNAQAMAEINQLTAALGDKSSVQESINFLDGRYNFLGVSERKNMRGGEVLRSTDQGANFFFDSENVQRKKFNFGAIVLDKEVYEKYKAQQGSSIIGGSGKRQPLYGWTTGRTGYGIQSHVFSPSSQIGDILPHHTDRYNADISMGRKGFNSWDFSLAASPTAPVEGTPVYTPGPAKVISVQDWKSAGERIVLEDLESGERYHVLHVENVNVKPGQTLDGGAQIAKISRQYGANSGKNQYVPHVDLHSSKEFAYKFIKSHVTGSFRTFSDSKKPSLRALDNKAKNLTSSTPVNTKYGHAKYKVAERSELKDVGNGVMLHNDAAYAWKRMVQAAARDGVTLTPGSGFRSTEEQAKLWRNQVAKHNGNEAAAAKLSAPPGYSQHETGYAIDLWHPDTGLSQDFQNTAAFKWMEKYGQRYGFELSFKKNNPHGVSYEPWHWMYVGSPGAKQEYEKMQKAANLQASASRPVSGQENLTASASISNSASIYPTPEIVSQRTERQITDKAIAQAQPASEERAVQLNASIHPTVLRPETSIEEIEQRETAKEKVRVHTAQQVAEAKSYFDKKAVDTIAKASTIEIKTNADYDASIHETGLSSKKPADSIAHVKSYKHKDKIKISINYSTHESLPKYVTGFEETSQYTHMETALLA